MFGKPSLKEDGSVTFVAAATQLAGLGFGYLFARISSEGIKTINKKPFVR
jgi:hypothetical protein